MGKTKDAVERVVFDARCGNIEIEYEAAPRRHYKLRVGDPDMRDWVEVPSVTTVLDVLSKDGLPWWGQGVALDGVLKLWRFPDGFITVGQDGSLACWDDDIPGYVVATKEALTKLLVQRKLSVNHIRDQAGDRGQTVHDAFQAWVDDGTMPDPIFYPETERGYVVALLEWIGDVDSFTQGKSEVMVGSYVHRFAGRYDAEGKLKGNFRVRRGSPGGRRPEERADIEGLTLLDLKTSKGIYPSHHLQLEAYEEARKEGGLPPTKQRVVIQLSADGTYECAISRAEFGDYEAVLRVFNAIQRIKGR